jgi:hypothetical protein
MQQRRLKLLICCFSYGGNGGMKSEHPDVRDWLIDWIPRLEADPRIESVARLDIADTPITMTRNRAVVTARAMGADLLLMLDSDMRPDNLIGQDHTAVPFLEVALDRIYDHWEKGPLVIGAPYCGPPPNECVYVFRWRTRESHHPGIDMALDMYGREEAAERTGLEEVAALPTGLILFDMRAFELTEPREKGDHSWFYYEYTDLYQTQKASTEDVTATRDISLIGEEKLGYNPLLVAWNCWAGHWKPKCVSKPTIIHASSVGKKMADAARERLPSDTRVQMVKTDTGRELLGTAGGGEWGPRSNGHSANY